MTKRQWLVVIATFLIFPGSYLAVVAYIKFGGNDVKAFCAGPLQGKAHAEIDVMAKQAGLVTTQLHNALRVSSGRRWGNHVCDLTIEAGCVTKARANYRL